MPEQSSETLTPRSRLGEIPGSEIFGTEDTAMNEIPLATKPKEKEVCNLCEGKKFPLSFEELHELAEGMKNPYLVCDYQEGKYLVREYSESRNKGTALALPSDENVLNLEMVQIVPGKPKEVGIEIKFFQSLLMRKFDSVDNMQIFAGPPRLSVLHK